MVWLIIDLEGVMLWHMLSDMKSFLLIRDVAYHQLPWNTYLVFDCNILYINIPEDF